MQSKARSLTTPAKRKLIRGIAEYKDAQSEIIDAIKRHGGVLHQSEFDKEFSNFKDVKRKDGSYVRKYKRPKLLFGLGAFGNPETFWLGSFDQGDWSVYLELAQIMSMIGLIKISGKPPNVTYRMGA